jgi:hypothetical protein
MPQFRISIRDEKVTEYVIEADSEDVVIEEAASLTAEELNKCRTKTLHSVWHVETVEPVKED